MQQKTMSIDASEKALSAIQIAKNALDEEFSSNPNLDGVKKFEDIEKIVINVQITKD